MLRTRMAPSPTGDYHIGHIRTLLYNYALAKKYKGKFILRIEDTDRVRYIPGAVDRIMGVIKGYGLDWDEGPQKGGPYEPYVQSDRLHIYKEYALRLVDSGHAYYCFCDKDRLDSLREQQKLEGVPPKYDKHCMALSAEQLKKNLEQGVPYVIRLKVPENEKIEFEDVVYGKLSFSSNDVDDQVLLKSDGFPTYHLAVVVDDYLMEITHVLRGNDWLPSTPKHVLLYKAFGWELPVYAHLPNLKEKDGSTKKLSKRYGSVFAQQFLDEGYLPEAILNFLMFLGWNPGTEKEIYTLEEFCEDFTLEKVHKTDLVSFDREKLGWINGYYIRNMDNTVLLDRIASWSSQLNMASPSDEFDQEYKEKVCALIKDRMKLLKDFDELSSYFFKTPSLDKELLTKYGKDKSKEILEGFLTIYTHLAETNFTSEELTRVSYDYINNKSFKPKEAFMTLRVGVTGSSATPPIFETLEVLGKLTTIKRLEQAIVTI